jgi:hypothetical protein
VLVPPPLVTKKRGRLTTSHLESVLNRLINVPLQAEQKSVAELQALLARTIEGVSFFLLLIDHRIGELVGQYVFSRSYLLHFLKNVTERMSLLRGLLLL